MPFHYLRAGNSRERVPLPCPVLPLSLGSADEKLGTICVGASICHGQYSRTCMLQDEILIITFLAIDGLATSTIMACEVTTVPSLELGLQTA